jgi:hypothetical protein
MQMIRNTKVSTGLVLVTALLAMGVSGTASALPEVIVGSHLAQDGATVDAQAQSVDSADVEEGDSVPSDTDADADSTSA